ncbi:hypothetical protein COCC4DRAFT_64224 [Bipolaris maydis ATCC 48331]|uniref:Uncharacterized protein n=3 Tax=Cochliobolus heterostrophus TaxID=5016 RepID=M2V4G5_COCH5|nr:uncharacterized protein COCC4DRAFT_64224 [Bipolaris maydis ATCC 48331]EMD94867.1 hypothetical protein COCHEDRAFT_1091483 [Bipolaris maydis C5]ENI01841.1 hypothetical protein COCC4DRAFT_64224 [Bipolaris maydis ATCC 48331]KAJ6214970.1 hypothetical protein PSV09DRAFT_1091483 [Bipolaris maydis]
MGAHSVVPPGCRHEGHEYRQLVMVDEVITHPYNDVSRPGSPDDVPLGHLVAAQTYVEDGDASCTGEAPPSYAVAVRQSYRDTLIQHIPPGQEGEYGEVDAESEVGVDLERPDDVRYSVERIAAMFVVAFVLLVVSGVLGWMVLIGALE